MQTVTHAHTHRHHVLAGSQNTGRHRAFAISHLLSLSPPSLPRTLIFFSRLCIPVYNFDGLFNSVDARVHLPTGGPQAVRSVIDTADIEFGVSDFFFSGTLRFLSFLGVSFFFSFSFPFPSPFSFPADEAYRARRVCFFPFSPEPRLLFHAVVF